jgi:hypothetical protein
MKIWGYRLGLVFLLCLRSAGQKAASVEPESLEMQAVLFSECLQPQQKAEPPDLWPVRIIYVRVKRVGDKAPVEYREFDGNCKRVLIRSGQWTAEQFANSKTQLKNAGIRDGVTVALSESSGSSFPMSFLKVHSPGLKGDIFTLYLRFRWQEQMGTDDPVAERTLNVWRSLLQEATPEKPNQSGEDEGIDQVVRDCAQEWPPGVRPWIWAELRKIMPAAGSYQDCLLRQKSDKLP